MLFDVDTTPKDRCHYCRERVASDALLCEKCGKWRSKLRNGLVFWSGFTGLVTFILSAAAFLFAQGASFNTRLRGADLQFRNISSLKQMSVVNNSSVAVILGTVTFHFPGAKTIQVIVDQDIAPGEVLRVDVGQLVKAQTIGGQMYYFTPDRVRDLVNLDNKGSSFDSNKVVEDLNNAVYQNFTVEAINQGGADDRLLEGLRSKLIKVDCQIEVSYQVIGGGTFPESPPCLGLVRDRAPPPELKSKPMPLWLVDMVKGFDPKLADCLIEEKLCDAWLKKPEE